MRLPLAAAFVLAALPASAAELVVNWAPMAASVEGYQIERRVAEGREPWKPIARVAASETRFLDRDVTEGVEYCYRVRGVRGLQVSLPSPPLCNIATQPRPSPPPAAAPLRNTALDTSSLESAPDAEGAIAEPPGAPPPRGEYREVKAIRRPPPSYPPEAQLLGLSGWVKLIFTVTADGRTNDIRVTAAEPPGVFDAAAIDAARRFVYAPRLENGVAVDRPNVETEITFTWIDRGGSLTTDRRTPAPR
jgi:TonB family protein